MSVATRQGKANGGTDQPSRRGVALLAILAPVLLGALVLVRFAVVGGKFGSDSLNIIVSQDELQLPAKASSDLLYSSADVQFWDTGVVILSMVLWLKRRRTEAALLVIGLTVDVAVQLMKALETPLSATGSPLVALLAAASLGSFPSGHVARTAVSLGLLMALFPATSRRRRTSIILLTTGYLALIGVVSVVSGGHTPGDILGAYLLAALWVDLLMLAKIEGLTQMDRQ